MDIRRVDFDNEASEALRNEFFPKTSAEDYSQALFELLQVSGKQMYEKSTPAKGGDLYTIRDRNELVGTLLNKYYAWEKIKPQLNFLPRFDSGEIVSFSLSKFGNLIQPDIKRLVVGELAYFWVNPNYRGLGIGTTLFDLSLAEFQSCLKTGETIFTLAMGCFSGIPTGPNLQKYLLEREFMANGTNEDGSTKVTGLEVSAMRILKDQGLDVTRLTTSPKSVATEVLARKRGFSLKGYSKNLSLLYVL